MSSRLASLPKKRDFDLLNAERHGIIIERASRCRGIGARPKDHYCETEGVTWSVGPCKGVRIFALVP